ncbi:MAG: SusD/RagB family nutrient-binding outer membrane lipoprotein [Sphingobacterium sp.]|jgi:hypothetical protein|nr:SusD/RagB family nutrient-binding outer membrane lipoprotein [Sphingobacterium sp.]
MDNLNMDPDNPGTIDPDLLISTIQYTPGAEWQEINRYFIYPGGFMNQWTGPFAVVEYGGIGQKHANYHERLWTTYYPEGVKNSLDIISQHGGNPDKVNIVAMARILKVQNFLRITDYYGDVPYSEAGLGYYDRILKPKYDTQESIYMDFFEELKKAVSSFDATKPLSKNDLFYHGDIEQWKRYANSLRLRIAMRLVKVAPEIAKKEAEDAIRAGVFQSNSDICFVKYENTENPVSGKGKGNAVSYYLYGNAANGSQMWLTTELVSALENNNDPRLLMIGGVYLRDAARTDITALVRAKRPNYASMTVQAQKYSYDPNTVYPTQNNGLTLNVNGSNISVPLAYTRLRASKYVTAFDAPYIYIGFAETEFLKAEVAARGWNAGGGTAASYYESALKAALKQWQIFGVNVTDQQVNNFLQEPNVRFSASDAIKQINTQLWILHFLDPLETWSNYRRSGYPELIFHNYVPSKNQSNGTFPNRMPYPLDEQIKNLENYQEAVGRLGADDWTKHVWWDK